MTCHTDGQLAEAAWNAGFRSLEELATIVAIAHPESGGCDKVQPGEPYADTGYGVWQITPGDSEPQCGINAALLSLQANACAAWAKYRDAGHSFNPWTTYVYGDYLPYMASARVSAQSVIDAHRSPPPPPKAPPPPPVTTSRRGVSLAGLALLAGGLALVGVAYDREHPGELAHLAMAIETDAAKLERR